MNPLIELNLALILFLPWFAILGVLYWLFPRQPRHAKRRWFDAGALALAVLAFVLTMHWAMGSADPAFGAMWKQVLATAIGYGVFLAVLVAAFLLRRRWWGGR